MACQVVCVSHTTGAKGETVGQLLARHLGFRYVDEQIIVRAAQLAQVDPAVVAASEEQQPLLQRLVDKLVASQHLIGPVALGSVLPVGASFAGPTGYKAPADDMRVLIRAAIHEVAKRGQAVIVAHAASMALAFVPGVLRLLVTASVETRRQRLAAAEGLSEEEAAAAVARSDRARVDYFRRFYDVRAESPTHYDLVLNTDVLSPEQAGEIAALAARAMGTGEAAGG